MDAVVDRPGRMVAVYAAVGAGWVAASSVLAAQHESSALIEVAKGVAFVAVTSALLVALVTAHDRRRQREAARLRSLIEAAGDVAYRVRLRPEPAFEYISDGITDLVGLSPEDHYARPELGMLLVHPDDRGVLGDIARAEADHLSASVRWLLGDGRVLHTHQDVSIVRDRHGAPVALDGRIRDVTQVHRDAAEALVGEAILGWISEGIDATAIATRVCERLVDTMEVEVAWFGVPLDDGSVRAVAGAGDRDYVDGLDVRWDEGPLANGPTGSAIRQRRPVSMQPGHPGYGPWRQRAASEGFTASLAVPLVWRGVVVGVLNVYSRFGDPFDEVHVARFDRIGRRLAIGLSLVGPSPAPTSHHRRPAGSAAPFDVAAAIADGRVEPFWQPQIDPSTGRIVAAEALVRGRDATGAVIAPAVLLPAAEESGLLVDLGRTLRRRALTDATRWVGTHLDRVCLNVSVAELVDPSFVADFRADLAERRLRPDQIELELVETAQLDHRATRALAELNRAGVRVAVDDYGSGWASLGHLAHLPANTLKIDRVFVADLGTSTRIDALVTSTIELGRTLGLTTVAEGVETAEHARMLHQLGCDLLQGFLYSAPIDATAFDQLLAAAPPWAAGHVR